MAGLAVGQSLGAPTVHRAALVARQGYSVAQVRTPGGSELREYVAPSGVVFGIAWSGPAMPDMSQWLGTRFADFQRAAQSARATRRHGPLYIRVGTLVVENSGHMRAFHGRAFLSDQIPATLTPAVVQ